MVVTIIEALGSKWNEIKLYDDNSLSYGGISREEETLGDFIADSNIDVYNTSVGVLQQALKESGIHQIDEIDSVMQSMINEKIEDLEDELGIAIEGYSWDYLEVIYGIDMDI